MTEQQQQTAKDEVKQVAVAAKDAAKVMAGSKKFLATMGGVLSLFAVQLVGMDPTAADELADKLVTLVGVYVAAQGLADLGQGGLAGTIRGILHQRAGAPADPLGGART